MGSLAEESPEKEVGSLPSAPSARDATGVAQWCSLRNDILKSAVSSFVHSRQTSPTRGVVEQPPRTMASINYGGCAQQCGRCEHLFGPISSRALELNAGLTLILPWATHRRQAAGMTGRLKGL